MLMPPQAYRKTANTHRRGNRIDQPLPTDVLPGTLFYIIDEGIIEQSDGNSWVTYSGAGSQLSNLVNYSFSAAQFSPPGTNQIRFNAGFPYTAVTKLFFDRITADGQDIRVGLLRVPTGSQIYVQDKNDNTQFATFITTTDAIDHTTWVEFNVVHLAHGNSIGGGQLVLAQSTWGPIVTTIPAHHTTHETGGSDEITSLAGSVITSGTIADARLSSNIAVNSVTQSTSVTGTQNNFNLTSRNTLLNCALTGNTIFTGFTVSGVSPTDGDRVTIFNSSAFSLRVANADVGSSANNRITTASVRGQIIGANGIVTLQYNLTGLRWNIVNLVQGAPISIPYNAADFSGVASMVWTVEAADVLKYQYIQDGKYLTIFLVLSGTLLSGVASGSVLVTLPNGFGISAVADNQVLIFGRTNEFGTLTITFIILVTTFPNQVQIVKFNNAGYVLGEMSQIGQVTLIVD